MTLGLPMVMHDLSLWTLGSAAVSKDTGVSLQGHAEPLLPGLQQAWYQKLRPVAQYARDGAAPPTRRQPVLPHPGRGLSPPAVAARRVGSAPLMACLRLALHCQCVYNGHPAWGGVLGLRCKSESIFPLRGGIAMRTTIEERVTILEKELTRLQQIIQGTRVEKDWRKTFGMSANDPGFDDMIRLGREIRAQDAEDDA